MHLCLWLQHWLEVLCLSEILHRINCCALLWDGSQMIQLLATTIYDPFACKLCGEVNKPLCSSDSPFLLLLPISCHCRLLLRNSNNNKAQGHACIIDIFRYPGMKLRIKLPPSAEARPVFHAPLCPSPHVLKLFQTLSNLAADFRVKTLFLPHQTRGKAKMWVSKV